MIMTTRADLFGKLVSELKKLSKYVLVFSEFVVIYVFCQLSSMHSYHKKVNISIRVLNYGDRSDFFVLIAYLFKNF